MVAHKNGSTLVLVIIITGTLSMLALGALQHATYLMETATARASYVQLHAASKGLMNLAIEIGIENFQTMQASSQPYTFDMCDWFIQQKKSYHGWITITAGNNGLILRCWLEANAIPQCIITCRLIKEKDCYQTQEWNIEQ